MFDDFDLEISCEEVYTEEIDWSDVNAEDVMVDGIPLDGKYLEHLLEELQRDGAVWKLAGLITRRSVVQIHLPQLCVCNSAGQSIGLLNRGS